MYYNCHHAKRTYFSEPITKLSHTLITGKSELTGWKKYSLQPKISFCSYFRVIWTLRIPYWNYLNKTFKQRLEQNLLINIHITLWTRKTLNNCRQFQFSHNRDGNQYYSIFAWTLRKPTIPVAMHNLYGNSYFSDFALLRKTKPWKNTFYFYFLLKAILALTLREPTIPVFAQPRWKFPFSNFCIIPQKLNDGKILCIIPQKLNNGKYFFYLFIFINNFYNCRKWHF